MVLDEESPEKSTPVVTGGPLRKFAIILMAIGLIGIVLYCLADGGQNAVADFAQSKLAAIQGTWNYHWPQVLALDIIGWMMLVCLPVGGFLLSLSYKKIWEFVIISFFMFLLVYPVVAKRLERNNGDICLSHIHEFSIVCMMHAEDFNGKLPTQWNDIYQYFPDRVSRMKVDPATRDRYHSWAGYGYNACCQEKNLIDLKQPESTLIVTDSIRPEMLITSFHDIDAARHGGGYIVGFCDGHVRRCEGVDVRLR